MIMAGTDRSSKTSEDEEEEEEEAEEDEEEGFGVEARAGAGEAEDDWGMGNLDDDSVDHAEMERLRAAEVNKTYISLDKTYISLDPRYLLVLLFSATCTSTGYLIYKCICIYI